MVDVHPESQTAVGRHAHPAFPLRHSGFPVPPLPCLHAQVATPPDAGLRAVSSASLRGLFPLPCGGLWSGKLGTKPWLLQGWEDLSLARTLQSRPGDRARYSGVSWAARLSRGRRSSPIPCSVSDIVSARGCYAFPRSPMAFKDFCDGDPLTRKGGRG